MCGDHGGQAGRVQFAGRTVRFVLAGVRISSGAIRRGLLFGRLSCSAAFQINLTVVQAVTEDGARMHVVEDAAMGDVTVANVVGDIAVTEAIQMAATVHQRIAVHVLTGQMQILDRRPITFGQCGAAFQAHLVLQAAL